MTIKYDKKRRKKTSSNSCYKGLDIKLVIVIREEKQKSKYRKIKENTTSDAKRSKTIKDPLINPTSFL